MKKLKSIKTFTSVVILSATIYSQAFAADTGSCGDNCTYTYDPTTQTLTYTGTGPNGSGKINISSYYYGLSGTVKNAIISEGITDVFGKGDYNTIRNIGTLDGKLVIPSTMQSFGSGASYQMGFGTVEINSKNMTIADNSFAFKSEANVNVIMSSDANLIFDSKTFLRQLFPASMSISCKGNPDVCLAKFGNSLDNMIGEITADYYKGLNNNGNYEEWSENGYSVYTDSTKAKLLAAQDVDGNIDIYKYDGAGNLIAAFKNGVATYKRTSYTPAEAAAAIKKGNNNTVTLTFK